MKKLYFYTAVFFTGFLVLLPPNNQAWLDRINVFEAETEGTTDKEVAVQQAEVLQKYEKQETPQPKQATKITNLSRKTSSPLAKFKAVTKEGNIYYYLSDLTKLVQVQIDVQDGLVRFQHQQSIYEVVRDIPVVSVDGIYYPLKTAPLYEQNDFLIPVELVEKLLTPVDEKKTEQLHKSKAKVMQMNAQEMIQYLSFLQSPIPGAHVSTVDSHLPGAPRTYRGGVHEGIDWFTYGTGKRIDKNTAVYSVADGVVVRADVNYQEMSVEERNKLLERGKRNDGQTPAYILDKLRGRTVWIQHENGVMVRYAHLSRIGSNIKVGERVRAGELVGYVGNSGTSDGAKGNNEGLHLHLDILVYGEWIWQNYSKAERRMILEKIFNKDDKGLTENT